ncbi:MAG: CoA transferase [Cytophagales bacterium]|nr:CoA transferase [Cytophagales bacterium]MCA6389690.1 CoA transferase [Cytophagales bacterium]MCA6392582.1 CoA transferase [Cytophagales bacterium]MCA6400283.1 CoA transferase [Cytophagales bacterium]MCA6403611.1 CoA transferase [Cytophagales bacterium]
MFHNLKVLELASVLAGPSVGQFFAELGAAVIKVENLKTGGDVTRSWKGMGEQTDERSAYFCSCNWGKKSIAVDLSTVEGKQIVKELAKRSDIIIASYKPGDAEKLGVSYQQLSMNNDQLIYGQITGYGSDDDRVGYDAVIQAESGFMDLNGEKDGQPTKMPVALIDVLAAHQLKEGLLLALLKKERSGVGSLVEVSLIQSALSSLANQATNWLVAKKLPTRQGSSHPNIAPYGDSFLTKDGKRVLLAIGNDRQFKDLIAVLGISEQVLDLGAWGLEVKFLSNQQRVENRLALNEILEDAIAKRGSKELLDNINQLKIPAGIIQNVAEAFSTDVAKEVLLKSSELLGVKNFIGRVSGIEPPTSPLLPPPHFGEHTTEILSSLH